MSSLESSLHSQPKSHPHQRQSSSSCTPPPSSSSPASSLTNVGTNNVSVSQSNDRILKEASTGHHNATVLSVGQNIVMLPPHTRMGNLNVPHDLLESNLEFGQNDFSTHYGNAGEPQNMFLFTPSTFLPEFGNKFTSPISSSRDNMSLHDAIEMAQREKYVKDRQLAHEESIRGVNKSIIMLQNSPSVISSISRYSNSVNNSITTTSSSNVSSTSGFSRPNILHYQSGSGANAMLGSAVYAGEGDLLNDGGLEVPGSTGFLSLDGLLSSSIGNNSNSNSIRLPDLLDREVSQEGYLDVSGGPTSLRLSPNTFDPPLNNNFGERSRLGVISDGGVVDVSPQSDANVKSGSEVSASTAGSMSSGSLSTTSSFATNDKLKVKPKPTKVTSPSGRVGTQPCPTCGKVFSNSSALTKHKLTHSDERKFVCQLCAKAFKRQDHLNGHMLTHRNKKPYECDVGGCGKSYCDARSLRRHKENHHTNSSMNQTLPSSTTTALIPVQVGTNCVIPAHVNINTLQSAFTTGLPHVISNGGDATVTSNRIRYAPPISQETSTLSQFLGSILPSAATQLQFLAFQQGPTPAPPTVSSAANQQLLNQQNQLQSQLQQQNQLLQQQNNLQQQQNQLLQQNHQQQLEQQEENEMHQQNELEQKELAQQLAQQDEECLRQHQNQLLQAEQRNAQEESQNQSDSPNNSSQAIDLTSVAQTTCTTSSQIMTVSQESSVNSSWQHSFQSMMMNDSYEETLKRSKDMTDDQLSSNVSEKLRLNDSKSIKVEDDCSLVGNSSQEEPPPKLESCIPTEDLYQSFHNRPSSPSRTDLQSVLDYTNANSSADLTRLSEDSAPNNEGNLDAGNENRVRIKSEEESEKEMIAPLLQHLLTPAEGQVPSASLNEGNSSSDSLNTFNTHHQAFGVNQEIVDEEISEQWNRVSCLSEPIPNYCSNDLPKAVVCSVCQKKFKNSAALNGHMRLHGGLKKENESKKIEKKNSGQGGGPTLQTVSVNVRALIEEKIIQRQQRIGKNNYVTGSTMEVSEPISELSTSTCDLPFMSEEGYTLSIPETTSLDDDESDCLLVTTQTGNEDFQDHQMDKNLFERTSSNSVIDQMEHSSLVSDSSQISAIPKLSTAQFRQQFRVPRPVVEKLRRHSDSDHFVSMKRPCTDHVNNAVASLLRRKVAARRTTRTGSDPGGDLNQFFSSPFVAADFDLDLDFTNTVLHAESLPCTPTYRPMNDLFSSFPLPPDQQCGSQFSFLERDLVLSSLDNPPLPSDSEFLVYGNQSDQRCMEEHMDVDTINERSDNLLDNAGNPSVFQSSDLMENSYTLCPSINALLEDPMVTETTNSLEETQPPTLPPVECSSNNEIVLQMKEEPMEYTPNSTTTQEKVPAESSAWPNPADDTEDDVFLSPISIPASPIKPRIKHRPEPLFIPPHVNTGGGGIFASRLRSPRLRECSIETKTLSPPPYTPPPMLSPVRNGPGLFWHILSSSNGGNITPKSAPITPNLLIKKISLSEEPVEDEVSNTPETDILPHVNIGSQFQAQLPKCRERRDLELKLQDEKADRLWHPSVTEGVPDEDIETYLEFASSAGVVGGGRNKEYALHILQLTGGNIHDAILKLMDPEPKLPRGHPLLTYKYLETDKWLIDQSEGFQQALMKFDKDFFCISKELGTKSVKQCIQFYYIWKKVHPEEYKRLRTMRRKREQESLYYNLRTKNNNNNNDEEPTTTVTDIDDKFQADLLSAKISFMLPSPTGSPGGRSASPASTGDSVGTVLGHFPCKICGKVFPKVKSRSAHMKSHRQTDSDKSNFTTSYHSQSSGK